MGKTQDKHGLTFPVALIVITLVFVVLLGWGAIDTPANDAD
ncbi:hypothetical protein [Glaciibacter superstes]|nr:hypothetical protein [Glaciibacter superstes]